MSDESVIKEQDGYRVRLVIDNDPEEPYDDGQSPLLRIEIGSPYRVTHIMATGRPTDDDDRIEDKAGQIARTYNMNDTERLIAKYLRAYWGATQVQAYRSNDYLYITYDTPRWRAYAGMSADWVPPEGSVNLDEYRAWIEGDCYGIKVEKRVTWSTDDDFPDREDWEEIDACWGFYGDKYARERALEMLAENMPEAGTQVPQGDTGTSEAGTPGD